jgi:hypothetical protein
VRIAAGDDELSFEILNLADWVPRVWLAIPEPTPSVVNAPLYSFIENGLSSRQRDSHAQAHFQRDAARAHLALVAVARTNDLPPEAPARAAHPHST